LDLLSGKAIEGLSSTLFSYQRETVATMILKEFSSDLDQADLTYIPYVCMDDTAVFYQPGTMQFVSSCPLTSQSKGGILCEELGECILTSNQF